MNEQNYPQFERLHILRTEALCSVRDRAFDTLPLIFENYGNGIINGCRPITAKDFVMLSAGVILHNNFLYLIKEPMHVEYAPTEEYMLLKIVFEPELTTENFVRRDINLTLTPDLNLSEYEIEICRFKLKKGAILRTQYTDFFLIWRLNLTRLILSMCRTRQLAAVLLRLKFYALSPTKQKILRWKVTIIIFALPRLAGKF